MSLNIFKEVPLDALFPCASNAFTPGFKHPQIHFGELFYFPGFFGKVVPLYQATPVEFGHSTHLMRGRVRGFSI
jgi:hypothetical protein